MGGSKSSSATTSSTSSTTLTNTGTGLTAAGVDGNITFVQNDPSAAIGALSANAFAVDRSLNTADAAIKAGGALSQSAITMNSAVVGRTLDTVDRANAGAGELVKGVFTGALKAIGDVVKESNDAQRETNKLFYNKIADNAGVAPQTLQQQQQAASSDLVKLAVFGALALGAIILLSKSSK